MGGREGGREEGRGGRRKGERQRREAETERRYQSEGVKLVRKL